MTTEQKHTPEPRGVDAAIAAWKRCELTPVQTHTELVRYAKGIEQQRDELAEALRRSLNWLSSYPGGNAKGAYEQARTALAKLS